MAPGRAESDFGLKGWIDTLGLKQIFLIFSVTYVFHFSCVLQPSQETWKQCLCKMFGSNKVHYGKRGSGVLWVLVVTDWKKKHPIPSFSIGSSPVADRCFVTLLAKKWKQISGNSNKQIANFRFRRKIGEISMHVLFWRRVNRCKISHRRINCCENLKFLRYSDKWFRVLRQE